jgi:hypothetical protein
MAERDYSRGKSPGVSNALSVGPRPLFGSLPWSAYHPDEKFRNSGRVLRVKGSVTGKRHGTSKVAQKQR